MNVSSIVITTSTEHFQAVMKNLARAGLCEIHFHDGAGRIVAVIESEGVSGGIEKMKSIMNIDNVFSVDLAYSYNEEHDDADTASGFVPDALT